MNKFKAFLAIILISIFSFSGLLVDNCSAKDEEYIKILIVSPGNKHEIYEGEKIKLDKIIKHNKEEDRKSTRLNSSHANISYAVFCLKKKKHLLHLLLL